MGYSFHCRNTPEGLRFRVWSSVVDRYCTAALTRDQAAAWMLEVERLEAEMQVARMLRKAEADGGSAAFEAPPGLDAPWKTERCHICGGFHHEFARSGRGPLATCTKCGEQRGSPCHKDLCR